MQNPNQPSPEADKGKRKSEVFRYVDIAWRMMAIVVAGTLLGWFLDRQFPVLKPWGTLVLSVLSVSGAMYMIIRQVSKKK